MQQTLQQFQGVLTVAAVALVVILAWWCVGKFRVAIRTLLAMPMAKKLWLATFILLALWFAGMLGVEPMHSYLLMNDAPATFDQALGLTFAIKRAMMYWLDTNTWVPLALCAVAFVTLIWRRI